MTFTLPFGGHVAGHVGAHRTDKACYSQQGRFPSPRRATVVPERAVGSTPEPRCTHPNKRAGGSLLLCALSSSALAENHGEGTVSGRAVWRSKYKNLFKSGGTLPADVSNCQKFGR